MENIVTESSATGGIIGGIIGCLCLVGIFALLWKLVSGPSDNTVIVEVHHEAKDEEDEVHEDEEEVHEEEEEIVSE